MPRTLTLTVAALLGCSPSPHPAPLAGVGSTPGGYSIEVTPEGRRVRDRAGPLQRAYFDIGVDDDKTAWLFPRPDDAIAKSCQTHTALTELANRYGLCSVPAQEGDFVTRINRLSLDDALYVKRTIERTLVFCPWADGRNIAAVEPEPRQRDVQALCAMAGASGLSAALCDYHSPSHTTLEHRVFEENEYVVLAARTNELYGIAPSVVSAGCHPGQ